MRFPEGKAGCFKHVTAVGRLWWDAFDNIPFLPKEFLADPEGEDIEAVYAPFWIYHTLATGNYEYEAEKRREGAGETIVSVYHLQRTFAGRYDYVPVDVKDDLAAA